MKKESKVAWPKEHTWNADLLQRLRSGLDVNHSALLAAVADANGRRVFDYTSRQPLKKENFVIFQYAVFLQRPDGRVALFHRASFEQGQKRITVGPSILLSNSNPDPPSAAVPRLLVHQLCVGKKARIAGISPRGMFWNALARDKDGCVQPTYLFAIYRYEMADDIPLHGRFKDSPDSFVDWVPARDLARKTTGSGFVDQFLARQIAAATWDGNDDMSGRPHDPNDVGVLYSPSSQLVEDDRPRGQFESLAFERGHNVFISHASIDSFSAYALYRFLIDESSRTIFATIDLEDMRDGERLGKLERLIRECDGVVLLITPSLLRKSEELKASGKKDWVRWEIETAKQLGKPVIGFKLGSTARPDYLAEDLVANNKAEYCDWLKEVQELIRRVREKFSHCVDHD